VFEFGKIKQMLSIKDISIIKIDVEGAELEVLESLYKTISNFRPFIIIEILPAYNKQNKQRIDRQNKIEVICRKLDYAICRVIKNRNMKFKKLEKLDEIGIHSDLNKCDYVLAPKDLDVN
jgi:hypothetical protein